jgi:hypothetical protein
MEYRYTWKNWKFWSFGLHRYGTTRGANLQIALGPFRFEFERLNQVQYAPQNLGDLGGKPWQGRKSPKAPA